MTDKVKPAVGQTAISQPAPADQAMLVYKIARLHLDEKSLPKCFNRLIFFILVPVAPA